MTISCGIDFGTSNSALATASAKGVRLASVEGDQKTLPSAIFYPHDGMPKFGRQAIRSFIEGEEGRFMRSLKRILGTALMGHGTLVNGRNKKFESILSEFIGRMKTEAENQAGLPLENVVMGRPVHFIDGDTAADLRAQAELEKIAKQVGFKRVEFQYEPIAAAFAHERNVTGEKLAIVIDIGGGTSDFTVIRLSERAKDKIDRRDDILANTGVRIGGNDFDKDLCLAVFMPPLGLGTMYGDKNMPVPVSPFFDMSEWSKINFLYTPKMRSQMQALHAQSHDQEKLGRFIKVLKEETGHQLLGVVEESKVALTDLEETTAPLAFIQDGLALPVMRGTFNAAVEKHISGISRAMAECLAQANTRAESIDLVVLTGGTTEVPALRAMVKNHFPHAMISEENKLSSVGLGLGYDSLRRFGAPFAPAQTDQLVSYRG